MSRYAGSTHVGSGLLSRNNPRFQAGMRAITAGIDGAMFHQSLSGFHGWDRIARLAIQNKEKHLILVGHSNFVYAILKIAEAVKEAGIPCYLVALDKTLKACPAVGSNVVEVHEFWAGLSRVERGPDFAGVHSFKNFEEESHISVIENEKVQRQVIEIVSRWKVELESK